MGEARRRGTRTERVAMALEKKWAKREEMQRRARENYKQVFGREVDFTGQTPIPKPVTARQLQALAIIATAFGLTLAPRAEVSGR